MLHADALRLDRRLNSMVFLSALRRRPDAATDPGRFPWNLPLVRNLETLEFTTPVTFRVGENGSGRPKRGTIRTTFC